MKELTFDVPGVSCQHCVNAITEETSPLGIQKLTVDLDSKQVFVTFDPTTVKEAKIREAIEEAGYPVTGQHEGFVRKLETRFIKAPRPPKQD